MARAIAEAGLLREADWVIPVPLHPTRTAKRGFSQSHLLAHHALRLIGGNTLSMLRTDLLRRHRPTRPQTELPPPERQANVAGAFSPAPRRLLRRSAPGAEPGPALAGSAVLLIDDVLTTGSTLDACARTLKSAGARRVSAAVLARA